MRRPSGSRAAGQPGKQTWRSTRRRSSHKQRFSLFKACKINCHFPHEDDDGVGGGDGVRPTGGKTLPPPPCPKQEL